MLTQLHGLAGAASARPVATVLAGALGFSCLYALASLWLPFGWDHGFMASAGDVMARGGVLYRDAWEIKGPLAYVPFALATILFGHVMWGIRLIEIAILVPALIVLQRRIGALTSGAVGAGSALALYLWFASKGWFFSAQPEIWASVAIAAGIGLLLKPEPWRAPAGPTALLVGALIACAGLIKPNYLVFGAVPLASLAIAPGLSLMQRGILSAWLAAGAALPIAVVVGYFAAVGGLDALIEVVVLFNLGTYGGAGAEVNLPPKDIVFGVGAFLAEGPITIAGPFAALGLWARRRERMLVVPLSIWLALAFLGVVAQGKLYTYHWFLLYPPLVICAALGLHALLQEGRAAPTARALGLLAVALFAAHVAVSPGRDVLRWGRLMVGQLGDDYYDAYRRETYTATDEVLAARYVRERTEPQDGLFVWGNDAAARYLSDRPNPSRFTYNLPLILDGPFKDPYRAEMMQELTDAPPAYVIVGSPWDGSPKAEALSGFPELEAFLSDRYAFEVSIGYLDLYRRADMNTP